MLGDQADIASRQKEVSPPQWFAGPDSKGNSQTPVLDSLLCGFGAVGAWLYSLLSYVTLQMRLQTSTDGWLEIAALDFFGPGNFPRLAGENDAAYAARIQAALLPKANTETNLQAALEALTGQPVRMIEPWDPRDTGVYDVAFYDVDTTENPGRYTNPGERYYGFIECCLPVAPEIGAEPAETTYDGVTFYDAFGWYWDASAAAGGGADLVYDLINKLKVESTIIWVKFVPPPGTISPFILDQSLLDGPDVLT